jgi:hypothetical protein
MPSDTLRKLILSYHPSHTPQNLSICNLHPNIAYWISSTIALPSCLHHLGLQNGSGARKLRPSVATLDLFLSALDIPDDSFLDIIPPTSRMALCQAFLQSIRSRYFPTSIRSSSNRSQSPVGPVYKIMILGRCSSFRRLPRLHPPTCVLKYEFVITGYRAVCYLIWNKWDKLNH